MATSVEQGRTVGLGGRMTLVEHLKELRYRLLVSLAAVAAGVAVAYALWSPIYDFLRAPYCGTVPGHRDCNLYALGIFDQFHVRLHVSMIAGVLLAAPVWIYHLARFLTPAMYRRERRYAVGFFACALVLFGAGATMAYLTVGRGLDLFLGVAGGHVTPLVSVQSYLSFVTLMLVAFGIAFEFPLVVLFLNLTGVLSADRMRSSRRGVIFGLFALSAVLTPTSDPFTFLAMALPLVVLYEGCILVARTRSRRADKRRTELDQFHEELAREAGYPELSSRI